MSKNNRLNFSPARKIQTVVFLPPFRRSPNARKKPAAKALHGFLKIV